MNGPVQFSGEPEPALAFSLDDVRAELTESSADGPIESEGEPAAEASVCEHCSGSFTARKSAGRPQQFCSAACRKAFHNAERSTSQSEAETLGTSGADPLDLAPKKS